MPTDTQSAALFPSLRKFLDNGLGAIHNRVELFAVELKEEKNNILELVMCLAIALFFGMMALIVLTATVIFFFEGAGRLCAAGAFFTLYVVGGAIAWNRAKTRIRETALPFSDTIGEMRKDRAWVASLK
jgi:uncharacterized membrane protein YqjE